MTRSDFGALSVYSDTSRYQKRFMADSSEIIFEQRPLQRFHPSSKNNSTNLNNSVEISRILDIPRMTPAMRRNLPGLMFGFVLSMKSF